MRLNGNQVAALEQLGSQGFFHFDVGEDALDRRVVRLTVWDFEYSRMKNVDINENGTIFERTI